MTEITLKLPTAMLDALRRVAAEDDVSPGQLVREAIERSATPPRDSEDAHQGG